MCGNNIYIWEKNRNKWSVMFSVCLKEAIMVEASKAKICTAAHA